MICVFEMSRIMLLILDLCVFRCIDVIRQYFVKVFMVTQIAKLSLSLRLQNPHSKAKKN